MNPTLKRNLNSLIVESSQRFGNDIEELVSDFDQVELVGRCSSISDIYHTLQSLEIDLILMDAKSAVTANAPGVKRDFPHLHIILIGQEAETELEVFSDLIFDFLPLPLTKFRLKLIVDRLCEYLNQQQSLAFYHGQEQKPFITIQAKGIQHKLFLSNIYLVEANGEYVNFHTLEGKFMTLGALKKEIDRLDSDFVQVHRSYIVNTQFIVAKTRTKIRLAGNKVIPIGITYRNKLPLK